MILIILLQNGWLQGSPANKARVRSQSLAKREFNCDWFWTAIRITGSLGIVYDRLSTDFIVEQ
jgi:hypothetical protein